MEKQGDFGELLLAPEPLEVRELFLALPGTLSAAFGVVFSIKVAQIL